MIRFRTPYPADRYVVQAAALMATQLADAGVEVTGRGVPGLTAPRFGARAQAIWDWGRPVGRDANLVLVPWLEPDLSAWMARQPRTRFGALLPIPDPAPLGNLAALPLAIPRPYYLPGDTTMVFRATQALHLEERPRLLYAGWYQDGRALTLALSLARTLLARGGELILLEGLAARARLAPVVQQLGLVGKVIFAPPLDHAMTAALFHSADLLIAPERDRDPPLALTLAQAAGLPSVTVDDPRHAVASGHAAIAVAADAQDSWRAAVEKALGSTSWREIMIRRGTDWAKALHPEEALPLWQTELLSRR
ncbi:MAG: glycosyltransferase [Firmicutes bacterium]|nr:glycosyltransferase [Bacillota bacterium]